MIIYVEKNEAYDPRGNAHEVKKWEIWCCDGFYNKAARSGAGCRRTLCDSVNMTEAGLWIIGKLNKEDADFINIKKIDELIASEGSVFGISFAGDVNINWR